MDAHAPLSAPTHAGAPIPTDERRSEPREPAIGTLWMIDNIASAIIRCRCIDVSHNGMRLRIPLGYGVREGQTYQLCSHRPGQSQPPGLGLMVSRRATVTRTDIVVDGDHDMLDVGVALDVDRTAVVGAPLSPAIAHA